MKINEKPLLRLIKRLTAGFLAALLLFKAAAPEVMISYASTLGDVGTVIPRLGPYMDNTLQCIDAYAELGPTGGYEHDNDSYVRVSPSSTLSKYEEGLVFWGTFFLFAVIPASAEGSYPGMNFDGIRSAYAALQAAGLQIEGIYYKDFNRIIHNTSIQSKYPLIKSLANDDTKALQYLSAMGLMGGGGTGIGGKTIPSVFSGHMSLDSRLKVGDSLTIDTGDAEFLREVKVEFAPSNDSGNFSRTPVGGWSYVINGSEIIFSNSSDDPKGVFIRFNTDGTGYASSGGGSFGSPFEVYEELLEVWVVESCSGGKNGNILQPSQHQRFASLNFEGGTAGMPYAELGKTASMAPGDATFEFTAYRHEETFTSHYNLKLFKGDHETGKPLSGASFNVYESEDGNRFSEIGGVTTGADGTATKVREHHETFSATFCDGHPAPEFCEVPEEEVDPETGEVLNEDDIINAQEANMSAALGWLETCSDCESEAGGSHFHWIMDSVSESEISDIASCGGDPGEIPDAGDTSSASGEEAFIESGCMSARDRAYQRFINKEYYFTFKETAARSGYIVHGLHPDDIPIEVIKTNSSEAGAVSSATDKCSDTVSLSGGSLFMTALSSPKKLSEVKKEHSYVILEEHEKKELSFSSFLKSAVSLFSGTKEEMPQSTDEQTATPSMYEESKSGINETMTAVNEEVNEEADCLRDDPLITDIEDVAEITEEEISVDEVVEVTEISVDTKEALSDVSLLGIIVEGLREIFTIKSYAATGYGPEGIFYEGYGESDYQYAGGSVAKGPSDNYSHCNNIDGEGNMWRIYDHRTEGEIHINKRDFDLSDNTGADFDDYAEENGDATLFGAVYGLFAASAVIHPDGHTGVVYAADDLVSVAVTDRDGNASFIKITVEPDSTYDYVTNTVKRRNNRNTSSLTNLYSHAHTDMDYSPKGRGRTYEDLRGRNGNEWIGRPLLLGSYYIKELSRSEGYELSIGKKDNYITNFGQDTDAGTGGAVMSGTVTVSKNPWSDVQIRGIRSYGDYPDPDDHDYNEIYFDVTTKGTGADGFDIKLSSFPEGTKIYRLDEGTGTVTYDVGTGTYDLVTVLDEHGNPIALSAETGYDYPVYDSSGNPETYTAYPNEEVNGIQKLNEAPLDTDKVNEALLKAEDGMDEATVLTKLSENYDQYTDLWFIKTKVERALRLNGKGTPKEGSSYSSLTSCIFDNGDVGLNKFGTPVISVNIPGPLSNADLIGSILSFYSDSSYFTYGGVMSIAENGTDYEVMLYAGTKALKPFYTEVGSTPAIFMPVEHPASSDDMQRYVWAVYTGTLMSVLPDGMPVFGRYEAMSENAGRVSATLISKAIASDPSSYDLSSYEEIRTRFYPIGTCPVYDSEGNIIYKTEYKERKVSRTVTAPKSVWTYLAETTVDDQVLHVNASYTDSFGTVHDDTVGETFEFLSVVPSDSTMHLVLSANDITEMGSMNGCGYTAGDSISVGEYYTLVKKASVTVRTGAGSASGLLGPESFIISCDLDYPGQNAVIEDAGTISFPLRVHERPVRQSVKVIKKIALNKDSNGDGTGDAYENNTYGVASAAKETNFRFKAYLKSNLERICKDSDGTIRWVDENGNEMEPLITGGTVSWRYVTGRTGTLRWPEIDKSTGTGTDMSVASINVMPIRTKTGGERILEISGGAPNYRKFFDAVDTANVDKWDDNAPTYSSFKPIGNQKNRSAYQIENAKRSDRVRQFAITWYLKDEVAALTRNVPSSLTSMGYMEREADRSREENTYSESLFDEALYKAVLKAENYLRPFYKYDLDTIYSLSWDRDKGGGSDRDYTTLSADMLSGEEYINYSAYLPYGEYVIVEQQPRYVGADAAAYNDFINKWYKKDEPKGIRVPTVYDGSYSHRDIPYTLTIPTVLTEYDSGTFTGFADLNVTNTLYYTRLRIEKIDEETHENILHDEAVFALYKAERNLTTGDVLFYGADTEITGSRSFIEAYCRKDSVEKVDDVTYTGIVAAGTPVCSEDQLVTLSNGDESFSTSMKVAAKKEETNVYTVPASYIIQNTGYIETESPIGAGTYVLLEIKAPAGYVRSEPVALEVYSDRVTYYIKDGKKVAAEYPLDEKSRIFVEDAPIKLTVEKVKESSLVSSDKNPEKTVTYRYSGRIDGSITELSGNDDLVYAFNDAGIYQGYAWKKGTLEYLSQLKELYDNDSDPLTKVDIVYNGSLFAGYGYVRRKLLTSDDGNKYVAGATLTLFEALGLTRNEAFEFGKSDYSFTELTVERNINSSVKSMKAMGKDILYYPLDSLEITETRIINGATVTYGFSKDHSLVSVGQLISDSINYDKDDNEISIYAFKGGTPVFEFTGGDLTKVSYSKVNKTLSVDEDTLIYHLDAKGNRDALTDPYTGMAYVTERQPSGEEKYIVWTVDISRDGSGNITAMDKITTSRTATVGENDETLYGDTVTVSKAARPDGAAVPGIVTSYTYPETGSITGSWEQDGTGKSHVQESVRSDPYGRNMNGETLITINNGSFKKKYDPVYDGNGHIMYYQRSTETYSNGTDLYDRRGDYVRYDYSDELHETNDASYAVHDDPEETGELHHRYGEGYVLQNTWVTSDYTPNDPFTDMATDGQADILKRVAAGTYILEELKTPSGYLKAMPEGVTVKEDASMQYLKMIDRTTKLEISKVSDSTHGLLLGAVIALFPAKRVYSADYDRYPKGYYLVKTQDEPLTYRSTKWTVSSPVMLKAEWITVSDGTVYVEGIPEGDYILEEITAPEGYVKAVPVELEVTSQMDVMSVTITDDSTKVEIEKFYIDSETKLRKQLKGAEFALYEAETDAYGNVVVNSFGEPEHGDTPLTGWTTSNDHEWTDFAEKFRESYIAHGTDMVSFGFTDDKGTWHDATIINVERLDSELSGGIPMTYPTEALVTVRDELLRITKVKVYGQKSNGAGLDFTFEYMFDYKEIPLISSHAVSYTTLSGVRRFEGLPVGKMYVAAEETVPDGFEKALSKLIHAGDSSEVQRFYIKDTQKEKPEEPVPDEKETEVHFHKVDAVTGEELPGAHVEVRDEEGTLIDEWISSETPHEIKGVLKPGKKYRFIETINPDGYELTEDVEFTVNDDGTPQQVYMKDKPLKKAPDPTTAPEPTTEPVTTKAPETTPVTIPETTKEEKSWASVTKYDISWNYQVTVRKTDGVTGEGAPGAEFTIYQRENEKPLVTLTTDEDGRCVFTGLKEGEHYIIKETKAPKGYSVSPEVRYLTIKSTYKNDAVIYWVDQPERFKKFGLLYATGDSSPSIKLLLAALCMLAAIFLFITGKEKKSHEK